ncbi:signal peptidase II [Nocardia cyriacigeorgica]|uniref:signal peptidase II n=1 Tax=Nocardia cyriacigeorgica TaxID=135487 RepID=UPI001894B685|nr:signal peptidase II [Nocardia cyriacigeorgica]MBF6439585.1 signal peptidase II [Nocardia cyriacigeorgica]
MTLTALPAPAGSRWGRRLRWAVAVSAVAGIDLGIKAWARIALDGSPIEAGPVDLRLAFNPGAAFSIAADAPAWVMVALTTVITTAVVVAGWWLAPRASLLTRGGLAALGGGAVANVIDRVPDGVVTDYLHTGWWPTFNLADTAIVAGAAALVFANLTRSSDERRPRSTDHHTVNET